MSEWRRHGFELFPEYRPEIERAASAHGVFFVLLPALQDAYRAVPPDEPLLARIYAFAAWCRRPERHRAVRGAAMASFYEHLPAFGPAWRDLPRRADAPLLHDIREHLRGYLPPADFRRAAEQLDAAVRSASERPAI